MQTKIAISTDGLECPILLSGGMGHSGPSVDMAAFSLHLAASISMCIPNSIGKFIGTHPQITSCNKIVHKQPEKISHITKVIYSVTKKQKLIVFRH